ncbi:hypothetical protein K438DRAFT_38974 [Mycena galopus ATCC 62051]|nr:hypothetical protein K438DRAFT_38974 [Mycena galopus ATCC 62051]
MKKYSSRSTCQPSIFISIFKHISFQQRLELQLARVKENIAKKEKQKADTNLAPKPSPPSLIPAATPLDSTACYYFLVLVLNGRQSTHHLYGMSS